MPHPAGLPDLFVDRSLGRIRVPTLLREAGLRLTTLAERYGIPADEEIPDDEWLREAGQRGEAVLMKDERIRYRPAERAAVLRWRVRAFCLVRRDLDARAMAELFVANTGRMANACRQYESGLFVVSYQGLRRVPLSSP